MEMGWSLTIPPISWQEIAVAPLMFVSVWSMVIIEIWKVKLYGDGMVTDLSSHLLARDRSSSVHVSGHMVDDGFAMATD